MVKKVLVEDIFWRFDFGKHHGRTVGEVFEVDPSYLKWAHEQTERFTLSPDMYQQVLAQLKLTTVDKPSFSVPDDGSIPF